MSIPVSICNWLLDFLLNRPQYVKLDNVLSSTKVLNTGAPQGCVLSPLLYSLFTNDCRCNDASVKMVKFADDTTVTGLISNCDETAYRKEIQSLINWCENNNLILNPSKTKEMIIDYRKKKEPITPIFINNECIEIVNSFKFLGTTISSDLKWHFNTKLILKKAHQRLYFLRQLKKFHLNKEIMVNFYRAIIESILIFSTIIWFNSLSQAEKRKLNSIVNSCSRIIGVALPSLENLYKDRLRTRCNKIIVDRLHLQIVFLNYCLLVEGIGA